MSLYLDDTLSRIVELDLKDTRIVPFLAGEPGIGKTSFIYGIGERAGYKVFSISVNTLADKGDLTGARTLQDPTDGKWKQMFFPHATFVEANDYALANPSETVVILLDEINRTDSDVTSASMTISTERRVGTTDLAPNVRLAVTGNLTGNVTHLDSASLTRFSLYEVKPSAETFMKIMGDNLNKYIRTVLTKFPEYIFMKPTTATALITTDDDDNDDTSAQQMMDFNAVLGSDQDMVQFTAPRTIEGLSIWLNNADDAFLRLLLKDTADGQSRSASLLQIALESHTGNTAFTAEILSEMTNDLLSAASQAPSGPIKPFAYDRLAAAPSNTVLEQEVDTLNNNDRAEVLIFALHDSINAAAPNIIAHLASNGVLDDLPIDKIGKIASLGSVPAANYHALTRQDTTLTRNLGPGILAVIKG